MPYALVNIFKKASWGGFKLSKTEEEPFDFSYVCGLTSTFEQADHLRDSVYDEGVSILVKRIAIVRVDDDLPSVLPSYLFYTQDGNTFSVDNGEVRFRTNVYYHEGIVNLGEYTAPY